MLILQFLFPLLLLPSLLGFRFPDLRRARSFQVRPSELYPSNDIANFPSSSLVFRASSRAAAMGVEGEAEGPSSGGLDFGEMDSGLVGDKSSLIESISALFLDVDTDNSGFIDVEELGVLLEKLEIKAARGEIEALFNTLDKDNNGSIGKSADEVD